MNTKADNKSTKLGNLAEELLKKGIDNEAMEALKRSMRLNNQSDMTSYLNIAISLFESGDYYHTKVFLDTFLEYSKNSKAYFILGKIAEYEKNIESAFNYYRMGIEIYDNHNLEPYYDFLSICKKLKKEDKGIDAAKNILSINDKDVFALRYMAQYFYKNKLFKESSSFYKILVDNNLADHNDYHYYGVCLYEIRDFKSSEYIYQKALDMYPSNDPQVLKLKDLASKTLEENYPNIEESKQKYLNNIKENPTHSDYFHLGNIEFISGNYQKAVELYNKAKEIYTNTELVY